MCKEPENDDHVLYETTSLQIGGILKYTCPKGYKLEGNRTRKCTNLGSWSGKKPTCNCKLFITFFRLRVGPWGWSCGSFS